MSTCCISENRLNPNTYIVFLPPHGPLLGLQYLTPGMALGGWWVQTAKVLAEEVGVDTVWLGHTSRHPSSPHPAKDTCSLVRGRNPGHDPQGALHPCWGWLHS